MEPWFALYTEGEAKHDLRQRFRDPNHRNPNGAVFGLFVRALLRAMGFDFSRLTTRVISRFAMVLEASGRPFSGGIDFGIFAASSWSVSSRKSIRRATTNGPKG